MKTLTLLALTILCGFTVAAQQTRPGPRQLNSAQRPPAGARPDVNAPTNHAPSIGLANTNRPANPAIAAEFSITNVLTTMAPLQAEKVRQVQTGLNALQKLAAQLGPVRDHLQDLIEKNPEVQQELKVLQSQINALPEYAAKPSHDMVERLSEDLLRAFSTAQLQPDQQLVVATVINSVCNSRDLSFAQVNRLIAIGLTVMQNGGVPVPQSQLVGGDLHAIGYEVKPGLAR